MNPRIARLLRRVISTLCLIAACLFSIRYAKIQSQYCAVQEIKRSGGVVLYDYQWAENRDYTSMSGLLPKNEVSAPKFTFQVLGVDSVAEVVYVALDDDSNDDDLRAIVHIKSIEAIYLNYSQVTDSGLLSLASLPKLTHVFAINTRVTGSGCRLLQQKLPGCIVYYGSE